MVDLDFVAFKLIEQERKLEADKARKKLGIMSTIVYRIQFTYKSHNVEAEFEVDSPKKFEAVLHAHLEAGFEKRTFQRKDKPETFQPQQGTVVKVVATDEKWNNKPLWGVVVKLDDGNETQVNVFDKATFRKGDTVDYKVTDKGYAKIEHYGGEEDEEPPF